MSRPCLIAYDIAQPRRLRRLHRGLSRFAMPLQYSVFYAEVSDAGLKRLVALIERIINPRADDVRVYLLPGAGWARIHGVSPLPAGILFLGLPSTLVSRGCDSEVSPESCERAPSPPRPRPAVGFAAKRQARRIEARAQTGVREGLQIL